MFKQAANGQINNDINTHNTQSTKQAKQAKTLVVYTLHHLVTLCVGADE